MQIFFFKKKTLYWLLNPLFEEKHICIVQQKYNVYGIYVHIYVYFQLFVNSAQTCIHN
jgi:hypothetical protein